MSKFSLSTFQRLPIYLNYLSNFDTLKTKYISATKLSKALGLGEVQVRKDLATLNCLGRPKIGYDIQTLVSALKQTLGCNRQTSAVMVGVGKLGQALMGYGGFAEFGLNIVAGFDIDEKKVGTTVLDKSILPMERLNRFVTENQIKLIILTLPWQYAQSVVDMISGTPVKGVWNFTTAHILPPKGVTIKTENMASSLALLSKQINADD